MTNALTVPGSMTETGLELPADTSFDEWKQIGQELGRAGRAVQWWIGDWLNYGERAYGEKYAEAEEITGLSYGTLAVYASVAKAVKPLSRLKGLSFSHHQEVAPLNAPDQDRWLTAAEANGWSKGQLRSEIKNTREVPAERECCPTCGRPLPASATATEEGLGNANPV